MQTTGAHDYPLNAGGVPAYAAVLADFHRACRPELTASLAAADIPQGGAILDAPCGDGFFAARLAELAGPAGHVVGVDLCPGFLRRARRRRARLRDAASVALRRADVYDLPFADGSFDVAFCAHSLVSLDRPVVVLAEFRRVLRPGGQALVLETDELHHLLLPWPPGLEVQIQQALTEAARVEFGDEAAWCPARRLAGWLREAGFTGIDATTHVVDRVAPLPRVFRRFVRAHVQSLLKRAAPYLEAAAARACTRFLRREEALDVAGTAVACVYRLCSARR